MRLRWIPLLALLGVGSVVLAVELRGATADTGTAAKSPDSQPDSPPPPPPDEPPQQQPGFGWVPGYYRWVGQHYAWVPGRLVAGHSGEHYVAGQWGKRGTKYVFNSGTWVKEMVRVVASPIDERTPMRRMAPKAPPRGPANGRTYVVTTGGDDSGDGGRDHPWRTIKRGISALHAGDTLEIADGTYFESIEVKSAGTAAAPITIRAAPGARVIVDGGLREFEEQPAGAWEPVSGGAEGEFQSTRTYAALVAPGDRGPGLVGNFAGSMVPLQGYRYVEDLRSTNESWNLATNSSRGNGIYLGPGLWLDHETGRIHVRLAPTTVSNVRGYRGESDPRKVPLVLGGLTASALHIAHASHLRVEDIVVRGTASPSVSIENSEGVELDGLTIYGGVPAVFVSATSKLRMIRCAVRGLAAPWSSRAGMKYRGFASFLMVADGHGAAQNRDWEIAYNEFTDSHDGLVLASIQTLRFHHNLVDNLNDDGIFLTERKRLFVPGDVQIYDNVFSKILTTLAFGQDVTPGNTIGSGDYVFRNTFDLRDGTYNTPPGTAADPPVMAHSRTCGDHGDPTWEPLYFYQNTVITEANAYRDYYAAQLVTDTHGTLRRIFNNIFVQLSGTPGLAFASTDDDLQVDGNLLWTMEAPAHSRADFFKAFRSSATFAASHKWYSPGWGLSDVYADPGIKVSGELDIRLPKTSPAIGAGVVLPSSWPDDAPTPGPRRPDIGAVPFGGTAPRVGPEALPVTGH